MKEHKEPSFFIALVPILFLIGLLALNVYYYGSDATGGSNQIALLIAAAFASIIAMTQGYSWGQIQHGIVKSISSSLSAILILLIIGALAGTWMVSGIVPTMIYYGLEILNPKIFLFAAVLVCAVISISTGSSWTTIATVGVALLGIGQAMGINTGMVAGAVISGAYFGDKMSPLSDTTNLAPAMAGTDLFTHIRYMVLTTVPTLVLTLIIFLILGFNTESNGDSVQIKELLTAIDHKFYITPALFIVPALVIFMIIKKVDAVPALLIGTLAGGIAAIIFQPSIVKEISGTTGSYIKESYMALMNAMSSTTSIETGNTNINDLIATRGMSGMLNTIWLIICAMCFGGAMEVSGSLQKIAHTIVAFAKNTGSLIASTATTCVFFNATTSDQYLAIVVPGRMYAKTYRDRGLKPENLSRTLEDSGTVTSVLFPWNTCGATQQAVLHVATGEYWMYCFFNLLSPITTVLYGYLGIKIHKYTPEEIAMMKELDELDAKEEEIELQQ